MTDFRKSAALMAARLRNMTEPTQEDLDALGTYEAELAEAARPVSLGLE